MTSPPPSQQETICICHFCRIDHIKEGLVRFFSLIPYDIITLEVWNKVMSHWMEAINVEVSRDDLPELRKDFVKIFDPDMSPLGFDAKVS